MEFSTYKSEICHYVKRVGDLKAISEITNSDEILELLEVKDYLKAFYLLGMLDYLCKKNGLDYVQKYSKLRGFKFKNPIYPATAIIKNAISKDNDNYYLKESIKHAEPEFLKFNIVEGEIENVA